MKIVADENMPQVRELFGVFGQVVTTPGRDIDPALVADADILLVRSVTRVDAQLLAGSRVKFVGSATIGTDHLDLSWLTANAIAWASAPGCNAAAVADYVVAALSAVEPDWLRRRIAVIGCGNAGGGVYRRLAALGVEAVCFDPFLDANRGLPLVGFDDALGADILCLHTPLTRDGPYPTWHLFDAEVLARLKPGTVILNAGRGDVVDNRALLDALTAGHVRAVLDVWAGEPRIDTRLLDRVALGTPHIAGYSLEGRLRGSLMVYDALRQWLGQGGPVTLPDLLARLSGEVAAPQALVCSADVSLTDLVLAAYDPRRDFRSLREALADVSPEVAGAAFDGLRKHYPWRREFGHFSLSGPVSEALRRQLRAAGFDTGAATC